MQTSIVPNPRKNQDIRIGLAVQIYDEFPTGLVKVYKTPRAGTTTALGAESINRKEKFVTIVPTHRIAVNTICYNTIKYSDNSEANIIHILSNKHCKKNEEMLRVYPILQDLPFVPLAEECKECEEYNNCSITKIMREDDFDGITLTYQKLMALALVGLYRDGTAKEIIEKINGCKNFIMDEAHILEFGNHSQLSLFNSERELIVNMNRLRQIPNTFIHLAEMINSFEELINDQQLKELSDGLRKKSESDDFWKKRLSRVYENKYRINGFQKYISAYHELIQWCKTLPKKEEHVETIQNIVKILSVVQSKKVVVGAIRVKNNIEITLTVRNDIFLYMIGAFFKQLNKKDKRIFITSSTFGEFDYQNFLFKDVETMNSMQFGTAGDPLNTTSKMLILADTKKYSDRGEYSIYKNRNEICEKIKMILELYEGEEVKIITFGENRAKNLNGYLMEAGINHEVGYYQDTLSLGVESDARVLICVGMAYKAANSYDSITTNEYDSKVLLYESIYADTYQAWNRVKDHCAQDRSVVFALGCNLHDCENTCIWGYDRYILIDKEEGKARKFYVFANEELAKPIIMKCKNIEEMLGAAKKHRLPKSMIVNNSVNSPAKIEKSSLYTIHNLQGAFEENHGSIYAVSMLPKPLDLVKLALINAKYCAIKLSIGYIKKELPIADELFEEHLNGQTTICTYQLDADNKTNWIMLSIYSQSIEINVTKLCNFLDNFGIHYLLEKTDMPYSYRVWVFLKPVAGYIARKFALDIKKESGIDCVIYPKQSKLRPKDGYGDPIQLPLSTSSQIMVNGEWKRDFQNLEIKKLDISNYPAKHMNMTNRDQSV